MAIHPYSFLLLVEVSYGSNAATHRALAGLGLVKQHVVADLTALCLQQPWGDLLYWKEKQLVLCNSILVIVLLLLTE